MSLVIPESLQKKPVFQEVTGGAGSLSVMLSEAPFGSFDWVVSYSGSHDDATARDIAIGIYDDNESQFVEYSYNAAIAANVKVGGRGLIVPSELRLRIEVPAITAGNRVTLKFFRYRLSTEFLTCVLAHT